MAELLQRQVEGAEPPVGGGVAGGLQQVAATHALCAPEVEKGFPLGIELMGQTVHQAGIGAGMVVDEGGVVADRKSTRLNSSHVRISYAVFCLKKKKKKKIQKT